MIACTKSPDCMWSDGHLAACQRASGELIWPEMPPPMPVPLLPMGGEQIAEWEKALNENLDAASSSRHRIMVSSPRKPTPDESLADALCKIEEAEKAGDHASRYGLVLAAKSAAMAAGFDVGLSCDLASGPDMDGFRVVVTIELPTGQVSWRMPEHGKPWDGHTTEAKYERCHEFVRSVGRTIECTESTDCMWPDGHRSACRDRTGQRVDEPPLTSNDVS